MSEIWKKIHERHCSSTVSTKETVVSAASASVCNMQSWLGLRVHAGAFVASSLVLAAPHAHWKLTGTPRPLIRCISISETCLRATSFWHYLGSIQPECISKLHNSFSLFPCFQFLFHYSIHLQKIIKNRIIIQLIPNFFLLDHVFVYYFLVLILGFYHFWKLKGDWLIEHVYIVTLPHSN
jgi:hypothetical protein